MSVSVASEVREYRGKDAFLVCVLEGNPMTEMYWERKGKRLAEEDGKLSLTREKLGWYKFQLNANFHNLEGRDFGEYTCVAENDEAAIRQTVMLKGKLSSSYFDS